jgi:DNA (cytosine-5)-methyltransferase 1
VSLFAGCGGSSLGYRLAGFRELLAVEWDAKAVATFKSNFPEVPVHHGDIAQLTGAECMRLAGVRVTELDLLDGSPPCQGFSMSGKREMGDERNTLFLEYARLLREMRPKAFVFENVPGLIKGPMKRIYLEIVEELRGCGYRVRGELLNAMHYGVPQARERVIVIGVRDDLEIEPSFPKPATRPISVREALQGLSDIGHTRPLTPLQVERWHETKRGGHHAERFSTVRLKWDKVAPTILKCDGSGGFFHPDEPRKLGANQLKRLASFPDSFQFASREEAVERIGNSVPPKLMEAIARHVRKEVLDK